MYKLEHETDSTKVATRVIVGIVYMWVNKNTICWSGLRRLVVVYNNNIDPERTKVSYLADRICTTVQSNEEVGGFIRNGTFDDLPTHTVAFF